MLVLIVRHAAAGNKEDWIRQGRADVSRPITAVGRKKMIRAARALRALLPMCDIVATSPYRRAVQTAELLQPLCRRKRMLELPALAPTGRLGDGLRWLRQNSTRPLVALVGHEPHLGLLTSWLMTGRRTVLLNYTKGGAGLLEFSDSVRQGAARLLWLLSNEQLRRM